MGCEQRNRGTQERGRTRGACPGAFTPMLSGDGWLVRIRAGARALSSRELRALARLAHEHGNGIIELTRRANLQLRGVRLERISELQAELVALGLVDASPAREARPGLLVDPVAAIEDAALNALAGALDEALAQSARAGFSAKLGVVLDAGSGSACDVDADIRVIVAGAAENVEIHVGTYSGTQLLGECDRAQAPAAVMALLSALSDFAQAIGATKPAAGSGARNETTRGSDNCASPAALENAGHIASEPSGVALDGDTPNRSDEERAMVHVSPQSSGSNAAGTLPRMRDLVAAHGVEALRAHLVLSRTARSSRDDSALQPQVTAASRAAHSSNRPAIDVATRVAMPHTDGDIRSMAHPSPFACTTQPRAALGFHAAGGGSWFGIAVRFGSASHTEWIAIAELAERFGAAEVRLTPGREVLLVGVRREQAARLAEVANRLGFITEPHDPRRQLVACSGAPACSSAYGDTRGLASALGAELQPLLAAGATLHVSGCEKGCASRAAADVSIVLAQDGARLALNASVAAASGAPVEALSTISAKLKSVSSREPVRMAR